LRPDRCQCKDKNPQEQKENSDPTEIRKSFIQGRLHKFSL